MPIHRYFLTDFVTIQRQSFFDLLQKGLIEEFSKRNPITSTKGDLEFVFYPEYYTLTRPEYTPEEAIIKNKSYTSKLFVPGHLKDLKSQKILFKWFYVGNIPLMTKRGHFILNGAARVIVNQIIRSPGIYYQQKIYENYAEKWSQKPDDTYKRFYADLICMRGTWLRIEVDKEKNIWAQMKKGPKIPMYWFLLAMGVSEKKIFKSVTDSFRLLGNLKNSNQHNEFDNTKDKSKNKKSTSLQDENEMLENDSDFKSENDDDAKKYAYLKSPPEAWAEMYKLLSLNTLKNKKSKDLELNKELLSSEKNSPSNKGENSENLEDSLHALENMKSNKNSLSLQSKLAEEGRKWLYNKFMNPRSYNLGKQGRIAFNKKLKINVSTNQTTLTGLDVLYATDYLIKVEKGIFKIDDIDHLKNRRVRTSGELIQIQIGIGLVRLEKSIRDNLNKLSLNNASAFLFSSDEKDKSKNLSESPTRTFKTNPNPNFNKQYTSPSKNTSIQNKKQMIYMNYVRSPRYSPFLATSKLTPSLSSLSSFNENNNKSQYFNKNVLNYKNEKTDSQKDNLLSNFVNSKAFNSAIREFFGTSPLSQFMDQINPLAELTHKRRLSSMGPGGVTRDTATLAIRGIHPTHYGRICPIETPEGKNTGLVNSMTTYARVNSNGIIESPFYKVYKGQVQKQAGMYFFSAEQEEKIRLAAADLSVSSIGFLPKAFIPVRIAEDFTKIPRSQVQYVGVSPLQMISIATSLIPFLEHDDANRALMGSNMQRQAVPLIRPERPIVGTGLEARTISDSGHAIVAKSSGFVTYVSSRKIIVYSL